jgi:hypothetical protein
MVSRRDVYLRVARFGFPRAMLATIAPFYPVWNIYRERLEDIAKRYPELFPYYNPKDVIYIDPPGIPYTDIVKVDAFGCVWRSKVVGYIGEVVKHPLDDWSKFRDFKLPDPEAGVPTESGEVNYLTRQGIAKAIVPWNEIFESMEKARERGDIVSAWLPHGFLFLRLIYLRGWTNLFIDMYRKRNELYQLIDTLTNYYLEIVKIYKRNINKIDIFTFGDDLGGTDRSLIRPTHLKEFIYPAYRKIFQEAKSSGALVYLHTDGCTVELWDQLIDSGVDVLNIQDRPNGLENILKLKGRIAINLDIDRQLLAYGKPSEVKEYVSKVMNLFKDPRGGFMIYCEIHPPANLESIEELAKTIIENISLQ